MLADQQRRWASGDHVPAREYFDRDPAIAAHPEAADLVYQEYLLRRDAGDDPNFDDLLDLYPEYAHELRRLRAADELAGTGDSVRNNSESEEFELRDLIGRGGTGVVYKALQIGLGRVVALKILGAGVFALPHQRERFEAEAKLAARLSHPGIVAVHGTGLFRGQPYLCMEYVAGSSLAELCREQLPTPGQTAQYIREIAQAIAYAHGEQVLHRDLKPANVLIEEASGKPRVVDFGLAKQLGGQAGLSESGQLLGTPGYMAPEQATGRSAEVGPATDVYGLGTILYECLTGRAPFRSDSATEILRQVATIEPVTPRTLNPAVPRDLETICLKCLQKSPHRRYQSATELADDLERFLAGKPIHARPVSRWERMTRWCRRNPVPAALSAALTASLIAGVTLIAFQWRRAERERGRAEREAETVRLERDATNRERRRAESHLARAQDAIDFIGRRVTSGSLANVPHADKVRREMIEYAIRFHEGFLVDAGHEPGVRRDAAQAYLRTGEFRARLGESAAAADAFRKAIAIFEVLHNASPGDRAACDGLLLGWYHLVMVSADMGNGADAEQSFAQCEGLLRQIGPSFLSPVQHQHARASLLRYRLDRLRDEGQLAASDAAGQEARAIYEALLKESPGDRETLRRFSKLEGRRGITLRRMNRQDEAGAAYRSAVTLLEPVVRETPLDPEVRADFATARRNYAIFLRHTGDHAAARTEYRFAQETYARLVADFPDLVYYRSEWAESLFGEALLNPPVTDRETRRQLLDRALSLQREAVAAAKDRADLRYRLLNLLMIVASDAVEATDHASAADRLAELRPLAEKELDFRIGGQKLLACVRLAREDRGLSPEARQKAIEKYVGEFVAFVQLARDKKMNEWVNLLNEPDVPRLPPHPGLTRLLEEKRGVQKK